jgi:hypothetical protein
MSHPPRKDYRYGWEKLSLAVHAMAESPHGLPERLLNAYIYHVIHVHAENVPRAQEEALEALNRRLTSKPAVGDEGAAAATILAMSDEEAQACIGQIVVLFEEVAAKQR